MAGWLTALKWVPWKDVVRNAPQVAESAKKLWQAVGRRPAPIASADQVTTDGGNRVEQVLNARVTALETRVYQLEREMLSSSELLSALAEQQTQLVATLARLRWQQRLATALVAVALVALALAFWLWR